MRQNGVFVTLVPLHSRNSFMSSAVVLRVAFSEASYFISDYFKRNPVDLYRENGSEKGKIMESS